MGGTGVINYFFFVGVFNRLFVLGFALVAGSNHARNCMRNASTILLTNQCIVGGMDQLEQLARWCLYVAIEVVYYFVFSLFISTFYSSEAKCSHFFHLSQPRQDFSLLSSVWLHIIHPPHPRTPPIYCPQTSTRQTPRSIASMTEASP